MYLTKDDSNIIETIDYRDMNLQIFNRWGQKVFSTSDKAKGWGGYFQGKLLNTAVFDYHLISVVLEVKIPSDISLIR